MSTDDKTRSREEAQDEHTESPATSAGAKKEHNEHVVIIPKDKNEHAPTIKDIDNYRHRRFKGITRRELELMTIDDGKPLYKNIKTDPATDEVISVELTDEGRAYIADFNKKMAHIAAGITKPLAESLNSVFNDVLKDVFKDAATSLKAFEESIKPFQELLNELQELEPYIKYELDANRRKYGGLTFDEIMETPARELLARSKDKRSRLYKVLQAARKQKQEHDAVIAAQKQSRAERKELKENAEKQTAIMTLQGGKYSIFSNKNFWNVFTPGRIVKMGEPVKKYIDKKTGKVNKLQLEPGDIETIKDPADISLHAYILLNSIVKNSVDDINKTPIEITPFYKDDGKIRFYVKGVLDTITQDQRALLKDHNLQDIVNAQQLDINRKTAGAIYLEHLFKPLQEYIGVTDNGSRWSVFSYEGYDAETDIMTIRTPYLYQLWRATQAEYFTRQEHIEERHAAGKKPLKQDIKPLEENKMFKGAAYNEDDIILEIAFYITNVLLTAGNDGKEKTTKINYKTIIAECPRLKARLDDIEARPAETYTGKDGKPHTRNKNGLYNGELRKIARAFDVIMDPDECDARRQYEFIDITPAAKNEAGAFKLTPPTKSTLQDQIIIKWRRLLDDEKA